MRRLALLALVHVLASCTDPVRQAQIDALGPEAPGQSEGPLHRAGQPCLVCHSSGGPASDHPFAVAGTIYTTAEGDVGATGVGVFFVDESAQRRQVVTNEVGNFFVREEDWSDLTFPFKTGVLRGTTGTLMNSPINREGSCNACHQPKGADARSSIGPAFAPGSP